MSSFSMFDSKGGEVVGPKANPTHNNTKIHKFKIFGRFQNGTNIQVVTFNWCQATSGFGYEMLRRSKGENPKWEWSEKGRKVDYGVRGRLKSIIPQGDIGKGKISCKSSFHLVSFGII